MSVPPAGPSGSRGTVVLASSIHWNYTWQRHQQIAAGFAQRGYRVYFVRPLAGRWRPGLRNLFHQLTSRFSGQVADMSTQMTHPLPDGIEIVRPRGLPDKYWPAQQFNQRVAVPRLVDRLRRRGLPRPLIFYNFIPLPYTLALQEALEPDVVIYDAVYDFERVPGGERGAWIEEQVVTAADLVFADSPYHQARMQALGADVTEILPAADIALFERASSPPWSGLERPLCAYFGTVSATNQVLDLLREVSRRYRLRLIGPADNDYPGFSARTEWIQPVTYSELPELLHDADVLLLPYSRRQHIEGVIPAKTFECLATGKPTVVSGLRSLERFRDYFYLCNSREEFLAAIEQALHEDPILPEQRVELARENSWEQRLDQIIALAGCVVDGSDRMRP